MKKIVKIIAVALLFIVNTLPLSIKAQDNLQVAIIQLVSHPSLGKIKDGIVEGLKDSGFEEGKNLKINFQNAEGDMNLLNTIADQVVSEKPDIIYAITTPVAQACQNATKDIPVIFAGVTDPLAAKVVSSLEKPGENVTGISDTVEYEQQFELIKALQPEAKTLGLMYTTSEDNSEAEVKKVAEVAKKFGMEVKIEGINQAIDMPMVAEKLASQVDCFFVGADNTIASSFPALLDITDKAGKPVYSTIEEMIEQGAFAGTAMVQKDIGLEAGRLAKQVREGKAVGEIPVRAVTNLKTVINEKVAELLKISIPSEIKQSATMIGE